MDKKRILITYASYGSGHKTVANYTYEYLKKYSNYEIKMIDLMDYETIIGYISKKAFEQNFKHKINSMLFSMVYEFFDTKITTLPYRQAVKLVFKNKKLKNEIISYNPDLLISTHFFGHIILSMLNKRKLTHSKIISIMTDYVSHEMWIKEQKSIDAIIVSNDIVKNELINERISANKIYTYGIPISENFSKHTDIQKNKEKYNINNNKKTFLFFAGGSIGSSFSYKYLKRLLKEEYDINIIFVCGKNNSLMQKVNKLVINNNYKNIKVIGFSNEVNKLLCISDVVISKPGGLSITEALEMKRPMLLIPGNGANEIYNAKFVCKNGYGLNCRTPRKLAKTVGNILRKKNLLVNMKRKLNLYDDNNSIEKIYKLSQKLLKQD